LNIAREIGRFNKPIRGRFYLLLNGYIFNGSIVNPIWRCYSI
jgi:hypothetical protein